MRCRCNQRSAASESRFNAGLQSAAADNRMCPHDLRALAALAVENELLSATPVKKTSMQLIRRKHTIPQHVTRNDWTQFGFGPDAPQRAQTFTKVLALRLFLISLFQVQKWRVASIFSFSFLIRCVTGPKFIQAPCRELSKVIIQTCQLNHSIRFSRQIWCFCRVQMSLLTCQ